MRLPGTDIEYILSEPTPPSKAAAIFLPGMSGGALDEKYEDLADILNKNGVALLRLQSWSNKNDVGFKSFETIEKDILSALNFLKKKEYVQFFGIGKSLGASALLFAQIPELTKLVLWAPIVHPSETSSLESFYSKEFSEIKSWDDVTVSNEMLKTYSSEVLFIWGSKDTISNGENLKSASNLLPRASLLTVPDMGHTPSNQKEWEKLFDLSSVFIKEKDAA